MRPPHEQRPLSGTQPGDGRCPVSEARVAVVTDDAAGLPSQWRADFAATEGFVSVELPVLIDGQPPGRDGADAVSAVLVALAEGRAVATSRPAPGRLRSVYEALHAAGFEAIVSVHLSAELSGTVESARIARENVRIPVRVVDSGSAGLGLGLGVRSAVRAAAAGHGIDDVAAAARSASAQAQVLLEVSSLATLRKGGRVDPTASGLETSSEAKPLLSLQRGKIVAVDRAASADEAREKFVAHAGTALAHSHASAPVVCVHHVGDPRGARQVGRRLVNDYRPDARLVLGDLPAVLCAHVGPGAKVVVVEGPTSSPLPHGGRP